MYVYKAPLYISEAPRDFINVPIYVQAPRSFMKAFQYRSFANPFYIGSS